VSSIGLTAGAVPPGLVERVRGSQRLRRVLAVLMLLCIGGCSVAVYLLPLDSAELAPLGYLAVFVSTLVAGMAIMAPGVNVVVFVAGRSMDPLLVALVGGLGSVLGESTGYAGGRATRNLVTERRLDSRWAKVVGTLVRRNAFLTILGLAFASVVLADVAGLIAGRVGYSYRKFFLATFLGKTLRFLLVALLGGRLLPPA
jgi:membrane protein YqaA with SNARE-associated domain